jgi:transposase
LVFFFLFLQHSLDTRMERIRAELFALPVPVVQDVEKMRQAALSAGETLLDMAAYWNEATIEERRDIVWSLFQIGGLIYDLRRVIVGLIPRQSVLPVLALGLEGTVRWEQRGSGLWLRSSYFPEKQLRDNPHIPPPQPDSLTPEQKDEAAALLRQGWSIRQVASHYGVSRESIHRLAKKEGIELQPTLPKLTGEKREEALALLKQGFSLRQVAKRLEVNHETLRRLLKRFEGEQE